MNDVTAERWLPVVGYEGLYEVSDWGRVKSLPRNTTRGGILKQATDKRGAKRVNLSKYGVQEVRLVHHLVLQAFVGPCPDGLEGCHWDGDPSNNFLPNLRWDTRESNMADMVRHGRGNVSVEVCPRGHEYTPENTETKMYDGKPRRFCIACKPVLFRAAYERRKAQGLTKWKPNSELTPEQLARRREQAAERQRRYQARKKAAESSGLS